MHEMFTLINHSQGLDDEGLSLRWKHLTTTQRLNGPTQDLPFLAPDEKHEKNDNFYQKVFEYVIAIL